MLQTLLDYHVFHLAVLFATVGVFLTGARNSAVLTLVAAFVMLFLASWNSTAPIVDKPQSGWHDSLFALTMLFILFPTSATERMLDIGRRAVARILG